MYLGVIVIARDFLIILLTKVLVERVFSLA